MSKSLVQRLAREGTKPRHGVVGVVVENGRFLSIRRSAHVRAPHLVCFPGGSIEPGESPEQAVVRELKEELNLTVLPERQIWQSVTPWETKLDWWLVHRQPDSLPQPNPDEVAEWMWLTPEELLNHPMALPSVSAFFRAWAAGELELPPAAGPPQPEWRDVADADYP